MIKGCCIKNAAKVLLVIIALSLLTSCGADGHIPESEVVSTYIDLEIIAYEGGGNLSTSEAIYCDANTGVLYYRASKVGGYSFMTPILDSDGKPKLYTPTISD